jgi:Lrp/AsnC family transcriptional regulator, leucine-responsive regulatory protein
MSTFESLLDAINRHILRELQTDARLSYSEIGRRVGLTAPAVAERVRRLEEVGIITGYHVGINADKLGYPITVFIQVKSRHGECTPISDKLRDRPGIEECYHVTGERDVLIKASFTSVSHLEALVDELTQYGSVSTSLVLSTRYRQPLATIVE